VTHSKISDNQWEKIFNFLKLQKGIYIGAEDSCRQFISAVFWMHRSGAPWRWRPKNHGKWNSIYKRFGSKGDKGIWEAMHGHFAQDPDMESIMIDGTIVRAHTCAAGAPQSHLEVPQENRPDGRSKGGLTTQIHVMVDALGNPLDLI
jgi:transposase